MERIDARLVEENGRIFLEKECPRHGVQRALFEEVAEWHHKKKRFLKPGTLTTVQTHSAEGCPRDCGLCPAHRQHACIGLIEVTKACNMGCPACYAESRPGGAHLPLATIADMMDFFSEAECGRPEILQISGGEPTLHPQIHEIIALARDKARYTMLNTGGLALADEAFAEKLVFDTRFEVYLHFDGTDEFAGTPLGKARLRALATMNRLGIPCTLVCTAVPGENDGILGRIVQFALSQDCVRGVSFQPVAFFGRAQCAQGDLLNRLTLSGTLRRIVEQAGLGWEDFVPLPCNPYRVAVAYFVKTSSGLDSVCRKLSVEKALPFINNTLAFNADELLADGPVCDCMKGLLPAGFRLAAPLMKKKFLNSRTFRITVTSFVDRFNFDEDSIRQECVQILTPDRRRIPFSAYNMLHRSLLERKLP